MRLFLSDSIAFVVVALGILVQLELLLSLGGSECTCESAQSVVRLRPLVCVDLVVVVAASGSKQTPLQTSASKANTCAGELFHCWRLSLILLATSSSAASLWPIAFHSMSSISLGAIVAAVRANESAACSGRAADASAGKPALSSLRALMAQFVYVCGQVRALRYECGACLTH